MERALTETTDPVRDLVLLVSAPNVPAATLDAMKPAVEIIEQALVKVRDKTALRDIEPDAAGKHSRRLVDAVRPIGALIDPKMAQNDMQTWCAALVAALGDMPPRQALYGARAAVHVPMKFLNEVHATIRECAKEAETLRSLAELRLEKMLREMEIAATPKLEKPPLRWTQEDIDRANAAFAQAKIAMRYESDGEGGVREIGASDIDARESAD